MSVDPIAEDFPFYSPYNYAGNKPESKVDLEGLQEPGVAPAQTDTSTRPETTGTGESHRYRTPSGNTFHATGIHNIATAQGQSEVKTTSGIVVQTRTNALLQFDFMGENYKARFSSETLEFTAYKTEDGKEFPLYTSDKQYSAQLDLTVTQTSESMLSFTAVISGNEDWVWNETSFSFNLPIFFDTEHGISIGSMPELPSLGYSQEFEFTGQILFDSLNDDLPTLLEGVRFEYMENKLSQDYKMIGVNLGMNALKGSNPQFKTVIRAMQYSFEAGSKAEGKVAETQELLENVNFTPYNFRMSYGKPSNYQLKNQPTRNDSISKGYK